MMQKELKAALADRLEGWELVEFLQIPVEDIIEIFETEIEDSLEDVLDFADIKGFSVEDD